MLVRPPAMLRPASLQEPRTVCLQCLTRAALPSLSVRRALHTTVIRRNATVSSKQTRSAFNRDYFWSNGPLRELVAGARRGVGSNSTHSPSNGTTNGSSDAAKDGLANTTSAFVEIPGELPHRRRKRLKQAEAAAAATSSAAAGEAGDFPIAPDASSRLTSVSASLPTHSLRRRLTTYLSLAKPRLTFLILLTTASAYSLYPVPALLNPTAMSAPSLSTLTLLFLTTGTALCSASANSLNMLLEPAHDAKMSRTRNRPLVRKLITPRGAIGFAILTAASGVGALYYGVNPTVAFLGATNIVLYAFAYTPLKRISVINTWVGAIVGGIPPLMGWAAAAGQVAAQGGDWKELLLGPQSAGGWLLAALLFAWQFPHFNALSWTIREEYKGAGYRMMAWVNQNMNGRVAVRYSLLMFPVCVGLSYVGVTDWGFVATSSVVNAWMTVEAWRFWRKGGQGGSARGLFWASVWHLPIVLVLAMAHKKGLWERIWRGLTGESVEGEEWEEYEEDEHEEHVPLTKLEDIPEMAEGL